MLSRGIWIQKFLNRSLIVLLFVLMSSMSSSKVATFFRQSMVVLAVAFVSGGAVFLVERGNAESVPGITAFQAADTGSRTVLEEMKRLDAGDPIARLGGNCSGGTLSGENASGKYRVVFRDGSDRPMECSETVGKVAAVETTGIFGNEKRIVRVAVAEATQIDDANNYLTTGSESQYKKGALGIGGILKTYLGINANNQRITDLASPENSSDAATKAYVDNAIARIGGGDGGDGSGDGAPSGSCRYEGIRTDAAPGGFGSITFREGSGCKECHPEYAPGNRDNGCPWFDSCASIASSGYSCATSEINTGEYNGERTYSTSISFMCTCYKN